MNVSSVNNIAFGKIYTLHGPEDKMKKVQTILSGNKATNAKMEYVDATKVYKKANINNMYSLRDAYLANFVKSGDKVGYVFTDEDTAVRRAIDHMNIDVTDVLNDYSDSIINLNEEIIPNIF